ncbi:hypothetical protein [Aureispira anguillae]|uniref:Uncharacterized protein n=1 Tax=Aureispira anguillae TaxID=2864201 RepID=A0A916DRI2_9BACT|nr:hypothetical protein [Aureispira anguillae]BDS10226.1 hypothetical protein AsAng_0009340 [Aureispira anguillae]
MRSLLGLLILCCLLGQTQDLLAQKRKGRKEYKVFDENTKPPNGFLVDFSYGVHLPFADMAENFKYNFSLAGKIQYIFSNNFAVGLVGDYQFVDDLKTDVVANLREEEGSIIDRFGQLSDVHLGQRGFFLGASVSYLIPVLKKYKRSGIEVRFEGGYQQHWVRIEVLGGDIFALSDEYKKGYDRMTTGFAMRQYIGYRHLDKNRLLNFFGGFDIMQAFTKNRRGYNFDTGQVDNKDRIDILIGFRVGVTLPIYIYTPETQEDIRFY